MNYNTSPSFAYKKYINLFLGSSIRLTMESFKCVKVLGRGTFGSVHLVYRKDDKKQKRMAMKTIKKEPVEIIHFFDHKKK